MKLFNPFTPSLNWFNRRSVTTRFLIIGGFIFPFLLILSGTGIWGSTEINRILQQTQKQQIPSIYLLGQLESEINAARAVSYEALLETEPSRIIVSTNRFKQLVQLARKSWEEYLLIPSVEAEKVLWPEFESNWKTWAFQTEAVLELASTDRMAAHQQALALRANSNPGNRLLFIIIELTNINNRGAKDLAAKASHTFEGVMLTLHASMFVIIILVFLAGFVLAYSLITMTRSLNKLNSQIKQALSSIESKREVGEQVTFELSSMSSELYATSTQQTSGSQEQVKILTEIISTLNELAATSENISSKSQQIDVAVEVMLNSSQEVKANALAAAQTSEHGKNSLEKTIDRNQQFADSYEELVKLLEELKIQSSNIREVITLIHTISDETHLLSLNAAIEAAGVGEAGARFGVVANEIKVLANRSQEASRSVRNVLGEIEISIQQAAVSAQQGQQEAQAALLVAQESGVVITQLAGAVLVSAHEVARIEQAIASVKELTEEITYATSQQHSASDQSVETVRNVAIIARQNAQGSVQVTHTVHDLESLSHKLQQVLAA